ncbi:hypothetical protein AX17_006221 [Amanita inopinata Kibby_2008]|nr:hypothetical protein AX17_006221 [Amanita inopinata Kibby_2008]
MLAYLKKLKEIFSAQTSGSPQMSSPTASSFYARELENALREQSFGIRGFTMTTASSLQSSASVTLLEGRIIHITLGYGGYSIESNGYEQKSQSKAHETIEDLLGSISPLFQQKRQEALIRELERLR